LTYVLAVSVNHITISGKVVNYISVFWTIKQSKTLINALLH